MPDEKPKRQRAKRRDYKQEMEGLRQFCEAAVEILTAEIPAAFVEVPPNEIHVKAGRGSDAINGKIAAFNAVLKRMDGAKS